MKHFVKFYPDNYTDNVRTPWAGSRLANILKSGLDYDFPETIGEVWIFSTCPDLPSQCMNPHCGAFSALLKNNPECWLSENHRKIWGNDTPLLIKFIDAAQDLSLQLHPPMKQTNLDDNQCGKWESWYVLHSEDNAGIYLGLKENVTQEQFVQTINQHGDVKSLLRFVPVRRGDMFVIPPRTIHALGAGVVVLEPQLIVPGKSAISMRLYDWNRKYDENGHLSESGKPRKLHFEAALPYINFNESSDIENNRIHVPCRVCHSERFKIESIELAPCLISTFLRGTGTKSIDSIGELTAVFVLHGTVDIQIGDEHCTLKTGESGAIAASATQIQFDCQDAVACYVYCLPDRFKEMC